MHQPIQINTERDVCVQAAPARVFLTDFTGVFLTRVMAGSARGLTSCGTETHAPLTPVSRMIHCPWQHRAYSQKPLWFMELILRCCWGIWDLWFSWGQLSAWQGHCKVQTAKASVSTFTDAAEWDRWSDSWQLTQREREKQLVIGHYKRCSVLKSLILPFFSKTAINSST